MPSEGPSTYLNLLIYITGTYLSSFVLVSRITGADDPTL